MHFCSQDNISWGHRNKCIGKRAVLEKKLGKIIYFIKKLQNISEVRGISIFTKIIFQTENYIFIILPTPENNFHELKVIEEFPH